MLDRENKSVIFEGNDFDEAFYRKVTELVTKMKSHDAPYHSLFELEIEKDNGTVSTTTKRSSNLTPDELRVLDELEAAASSLVASGREPGKITTNGEIEKEL